MDVDVDEVVIEVLGTNKEVKEQARRRIYPNSPASTAEEKGTRRSPAQLRRNRERTNAMTKGIERLLQQQTMDWRKHGW